MKIMHPEEHQLFRAIVQGKAESFKVGENEDFLAILDIAPMAKGHTLLLPKRPICEWNEMSDAEVLSLHRFIKEMSGRLTHALSAVGISILQNGGECNSVSYLHIHLIPRFDTVSLWNEALQDGTALADVMALLA